MNFQLGGNYSVILMSVRPNAPYKDEFLDDGSTLIYEGHDVSKTLEVEDPKMFDQPERIKSGKLTQNGKFHKAANDFQHGLSNPELVRVYEKIRSGIWSYNGVFQLMDSWIESEGVRNVFKSKLVAIEEEVESTKMLFKQTHRRRIIPTQVKLDVWKRDGGKCVICGEDNELQFDHIIPYSKGGTSLSVDNIQLLCMRHNVAKKDKIE